MLSSLKAQLLHNKTVIFLMGPTASGKTDLAIQIAKQLPIAIISVDSALIYQGMDIGTAKPSLEILAKYPHALVNICKPTQPYHAQQFSLDAKQAIKKALSEKKIPLLVGGTSFYFRSLEYGLAPLPDSDPKIRLALETVYQEKGVLYLYQQLQVIDKVLAKKINQHDKQRIMRALEVYQLSGEKLSQLQAIHQKIPLDYPIKKIILMPDRQLLHQRIEKRFYQMLEQGFLQEMQALYQQTDITQHLPAMRCVGYRQAWQYLAGELDYKTMIERAIIATRQLCKRQCTWLKSEDNAMTVTQANLEIIYKSLLT